jgi:hypothetical protein
MDVQMKVRRATRISPRENCRFRKIVRALPYLAAEQSRRHLGRMMLIGWSASRQNIRQNRPRPRLRGLFLRNSRTNTCD